MENWTNPKEKPKKTLSPIADFFSEKNNCYKQRKISYNKQSLHKWNQTALVKLYYNDIIFAAEMEMKYLWKKSLKSVWENLPSSICRVRFLSGQSKD